MTEQPPRAHHGENPPRHPRPCGRELASAAVDALTLVGVNALTLAERRGGFRGSDHLPTSRPRASGGRDPERRSSRAPRRRTGERSLSSDDINHQQGRRGTFSTTPRAAAPARRTRLPGPPWTAPDATTGQVLRVPGRTRAAYRVPMRPVSLMVTTGVWIEGARMSSLLMGRIDCGIYFPFRRLRSSSLFQSSRRFAPLGLQGLSVKPRRGHGRKPKCVRPVGKPWIFHPRGQNPSDGLGPGSLG